jgi:hypothetical protein
MVTSTSTVETRTAGDGPPRGRRRKAWTSLFLPVRSGPRGTMPAATVFVTMVATLLLALALCAGTIERKANGRRPNNDTRRGIAASVADLSAEYGLDEYEEALGDTLGPYVGHETANGDASSADLAAAARAANGADQLRVPPTTGVGPAPPPGASTTVAPPPDLTPHLRAPTPDHPLRLWIGGDSISIEVGQGLARLGGQSRLFDVVRDSRVSTGITRPDYFNWPEHLAASVAPVGGGGVDPDVLVIMFGGNDDQTMPAWHGAPSARAGSDEWVAAYRQRVGDTMDLLKSPDDDRLVIWPGMPVTQPGTLPHLRQMNAVYASEAARRPWVRYFDAYPFFADAQGGYASALPCADGRTRELRNRDGIHLNGAGGVRLAQALYAVLAGRIDLSASPLVPDAGLAAPPAVAERPLAQVTG